VGFAGAPENDYLWWEGHYITSTGIVSRRVSSMIPGTFSVSVTMPSEWDGTGDVEFVVDYLIPTYNTWDYVYDPGGNDVLTTAGFFGDLWAGPRTGLADGMAFPVVHSNTAENVVCQ
jgi:hypothetical protein